MNLFIRSARVIDPTSKHHLHTRDLIIEKGTITQIGSRLRNDNGFKEVAATHLCVSPGWVDMYSYFADPGFEHKEDIFSGMKAAAAGGFTSVCVMPNTKPALHSKSEIEYVINKSKGALVDVKPIGAVSRNCEGTEITEIYDMHKAGAIAFSDGINSSLSAGLMLRSLLYVKPFDGLIISHPDEHSIRNGGLVNEGVISTLMGVPGIPAISEDLIVMRDLYLAEYTGSRVHFAFVSSAGALEQIRKAKARGLKVSCSVSPYNLLLDDESAAGFDANYKVLPPLKTKNEIKALLKALQDDTIDAISTLHIPQDAESKKVEFDFAEFGMLGLETAYAVANTAAGKKIGDEKIVAKLSIAPRKILNQPVPSIEKDAKANLTLFDNKAEWTFTEQDIRSKSRNSPFVGKRFTGKVIGVVNNNQLHLN
ncbi:MAG TPA: dihydroorotase [Chitinophagales bacterium]|nr:dihydroorotase [Chitinophagales bacterium]